MNEAEKTFLKGIGVGVTATIVGGVLGYLNIVTLVPVIQFLSSLF